MIHFKQFPAVIQELSQHNNGLRQALNRLETGSPDTPRSWFYEHENPQWILEQVSSQLDGMKDLKNIADWDLGKSTKFAPQGGSAPLKQRLKSLEEYFQHLETPTLIKDPLWIKAKEIAIRRLGFNRSGTPFKAEQVVQRGLEEDKYNTSSGFPLWKKRKSKEAVEQALDAYQYAIRDKYPFVLGTRASMGKTGVDARNIFMAPMALNVQGQRFLYPLQDFIRSRKIDFFLPWEGWEYVQNRISLSWNSTVLKFGTDYSKMDQHFNIHHGREVFDVVKHYFDPKFHDELLESIEYTFKAPIITNLGWIDQEHAMPSGSEWTNFLETMWDFILTIYLELKYHLRFILKCGIGDDQLYLLDGKWDARAIKWIIKVVITTFQEGGTPGNEEKQEVGLVDTSFLQRFLSDNWNGSNNDQRATGVYSMIRNTTSQVYPEFYHNDKAWGWEQFAQRTIMIAENCNGHPKFEWYVKNFVRNSNPNIMRFIKMKDDEILAAEKVSRGISQFVPTYNQASIRKSLLEFDTFKLLRSTV